MVKIHDSGYKKLFSNRTIFRELLESFVPEAWIKEIDFESCEKVDKSFISTHYKETESDIIYKTKLKGKEAYIFILIEFQSSVDSFMALRMLNYITNFYMDYVKTNKGIRMLPPLFPVLLYNGDRRWTAPTNLSELIENGDVLGSFAVKFQYFKIAENEFVKEDLLKIRNIVSTLFLAESHYDIELLKSEFLELFRKEEDKEAVSLFLNWFKQLSEHQRMPEKDYEELEQVYKNAEEVKEMLITSLQREREELYQKGLSVGIEKEKIENTRKMLLEGLHPTIISRITGLSEEKILGIRTKMIQ